MHYTELARRIKNDKPELINESDEQVVEGYLTANPQHRSKVTYEDLELINRVKKLSNIMKTDYASRNSIDFLEAQGKKLPRPVRDASGRVKAPYEITQEKGRAISSNPNLTIEEKEKQLKALYEGDIQRISNENKQFYQDRLNKFHEYNAKHPFQAMARTMFDPTFYPTEHLLKQQLEYEGNIPTSEFLKGQGVRAIMGGASGLSTGLTFAGGGAVANAGRAGNALRAKIALDTLKAKKAFYDAPKYATSASRISANTAQLANDIKKANTAYNVAKLTNAARGGAVTGLAPTSSHVYSQYANENITPQEGLEELAKWGIISTATGAVTPAMYSGVGKITPGIENLLSNIGTAKTFESTVKRVAQQEISKRVGQGINVTAEMAENITKQIETKLSSRFASEAKKVADDLVTGAVDNQLVLNSEYLYNKLNKKEGPTYLEQQGIYAPLSALGVLPIAVRNANKIPGVETALSKAESIKNGINNSPEKRLEKALASLNKRGKNQLNMQQVEEIAQAQGLSKEESYDKAVEFYTGKKPKDIKEAQQKAQEEAYEQHLQEDYNARPKTERNASLEPTPEEFMNDAPTVVIQKKTIPAIKAKTASGKILDLPELTFEPRKPEYIPRGKETKFRRKETQLASRPEEPIPSENVSTGINIPKKDLTPVNDTYSHGREKVIKLPAEDKVAEGGHGMYKQTADDTDIYANIDKTSDYDRTKLLTKAQSNKLKEIQAKYDVIEGKDGKLMFISKKTGKPMSETKARGLRKYFRNIKDEKIAEEYIANKSEIEGNFEGDNASETSLKYDDKLTVSESEPVSGAKYVVDDKDFIDFWEDYRGTLDENGNPTASSKAAMVSKLWEIKDKQALNEFRENVRKQQEYEKRLAEAKAPGEENKPYNDLAAEQDMVKENLDRPELESEVNTGYSQNEKEWATNTWRGILKVRGNWSSHVKSIKNKNNLSKESTLNESMYIIGKFNAKHRERQKVYDDFYSSIIEQNTSPRVKQLMVEQLNENASKFSDVKTNDFSATKYSSDLKSQLKAFNETGDIVNAGKLISKHEWLSKTPEGSTHWEQSADYAGKETNKLIKEGQDLIRQADTLKEQGKRNEAFTIRMEAKKKFQEASKILDKYRNVLKVDAKKSVAKERWTNKEVAKGKLAEKTSDGRMTKITTDSFGRTWEYAPTGDTYGRQYGYVGEGADLARKTISSIENKIEAGLKGRIYNEPIQLQSKAEATQTRKNLLQQAASFFKGSRHGTGVGMAKGEYVVNELPAGSKFTYKELADAGVEVFKKLAEVRPNGKIIIADLGGANARGRVDVISGTMWNDGKNRSSYKHEADHIFRYENDIKEAGDVAKAVYEADSKLTVERATFYKNNKESIDKVCSELVKLGKNFTDRGAISALRKLKGSNGKRLISENDIRTMKHITDLTKAYVNCYSEQVIRQGKIYGQKGFNEAFEQLRKSNPELYGRLYGGERGDNIRVSGRRDGSNAKEDGRIVLDEAETSTFTPKDKETLKKAKFSDRQIKAQQKISARNEQREINLGILTPDQARYRKEQLGEGIKWYAPQKHNPLKGEKITQEADYWNDSKVGLFGNAEKEAKERVTWADILQNNYVREAKINALEEVDKIIRSLSKPIGKTGVKQGYVAVNRSMLNSLIYNNNSYDFFKMLTNSDNLFDSSHMKKALMKDMSEEQADWYIRFARKRRNADYQIPEAVLKQALSFSKELASEQFHRYFELPKSVGKQGSLKFLATATNAVGDTFLDNFKRTVLATPSFVINNRLGNASLIIASSKNHIDTLKGFVDALKMKDTDIPVGLLDNSLNEAIQESFLKRKYTGWKEFDDFANLFNGHIIKSSETDGLAKQGAKFLGNFAIAGLNGVFNKWAKGIMSVNTKFENFERKWASAIQYRNIRKDMLKKTGQSMITTQEFIKEVKKHPELQSTVLESVQNILGNYNDFTPVERNVIKKVVPFYSWWRTITNSTLQLAKDNPGRLALIGFLMYRIRENDKDLKDFQKGALRTGIKDSRSNRELLINKEEYAMPWETLTSLSGDNTVKGLSGALNPIARVGMEAMLGKKFFGSGEITNKRYVMKTDRKTGKTYYWDTKERKALDSLPITTRIGYGAKELGRYFVPYASNSFVKGESLAQGIANMKKNNGKFLEPDKMYDADFGGYNTEESVNGYRRWAANDSSQLTKTLARTGVGLQIQYPLNKQEQKELKRKQEKYKNKKRKKD